MYRQDTLTGWQGKGREEQGKGTGRAGKGQGVGRGFIRCIRKRVTRCEIKGF